jgi:hypothetical protein
VWQINLPQPSFAKRGRLNFSYAEIFFQQKKFSNGMICFDNKALADEKAQHTRRM